MVSTNDIVVENAPITNLPQEPIEGAAAGIEDDFDKAQKKYQLGKKNLLLSKYDDAVNNIGDACKVYSTKFGEFAPECAEVYFYYGKALLELARVENTVLGNALNGVPEDTGPINDDSRYGNPDDVAAEEKEDIADKVIDAMCEDNNTEAAAAASGDAAEPTTTETETTTPVTTETIVPVVEATVTPVVIADASGAASSEVVETTTTTNPTETKTEEVANGEEEEGDDDDEDDGEEGEDEEDLTKNNDETKGGINGDEAEADDISNLQRSWEMFELAKLVFSKNFDNDLPYKTKRIAECLIKLGEISIEQELYEQALIDIKESIRMQEEKQTNERDERMLAESYYQFGLAYQFSEQFPLAGEQYQKSINILQLRIDKLKGLIEQTSDDFEKQQFKDEITELETILPEMVSKLEEIKEQGEQSVKLIQEAKECFLNKVNNDDEKLTTNGNGTTNAEVKDITSLVKSKRKISSSQINIDGENGIDESAIKKTKVEEIEQPVSTTITIETTPETTTETPIETDTVTTA